MTTTTLTRTLICAGLVLLFGPGAQAAPEPMTPDEIVELAEYGVGYSYWWGHGAWRTDGANPGSCSGSCPDCTHTGSYGADCSGYVAKVWQVPGPSALATNSHPYSTYNFRYESQHWSQISRSNARRADAMVYRNDANTGGHIVLYDSGDPWGQAWTWEARGCSYGIVHNLRTISSSYVAIRRDNLVDGPSTGTLIGSVYVDRGDGNMDTRIPGASVVASGVSTTAREGDAIWSFDLTVGDHSATASAAGFADNTRTCAVGAGQTTWCSIGLAEVCVPNCSGRACGPDGCGGSCGSCPAGHACTADGQCACQPDCTGLSCGPDPVCGQSCGSCGPDQECLLGTCRDHACDQACDGRECGFDPVCKASCGECPAGLICDPAGACVDDGCQPDCSGRSCGADPVCGRTCGICQIDRICELDGLCNRIDPAMGKLYGTVREHLNDDPADDTAAQTFVGGARVWLDDGAETLADENGYWEIEAQIGQRVVRAEATGFSTDLTSCSAQAGLATECELRLTHEGTPRDEDELVIHGGCASAGGPARSATGWFLLAACLLALRPRPRRNPRQ